MPTAGGVPEPKCRMSALTPVLGSLPQGSPTHNTPAPAARNVPEKETQTSIFDVK